MNIEQYREETKRTLPDLGSTLLNSIHMTLGIMTEVGEILKNFNEPSEGGIDFVNIGEELTDIHWYLANYANIHNLTFPEFNDENIILWEDEYTLGKFIEFSSELADLDKKLLAYNKLVDEKTRHKWFVLTYKYLLKLYKEYSLDVEKCRQNNIDKLRLRFPDKFDQEKAINRDHTAERVILER